MRRVSKKKAKARESEAYEAYQFMYQQAPMHCWACGRDWLNKPSWWNGPWCIERAHIVHNPRVEDRRAVIFLDSACHRTQHGERIVGWELPKLTVAEMIWLKAARDTEWFDLAFLQANSIQRLPEPQEPPAAFLEDYRRYQHGR